MNMAKIYRSMLFCAAFLCLIDIDTFESEPCVTVIVAVIKCSLERVSGLHMRRSFTSLFIAFQSLDVHHPDSIFRICDLILQFYH